LRELEEHAAMDDILPQLELEADVTLTHEQPLSQELLEIDVFDLEGILEKEPNSEMVLTQKTFDEQMLPGSLAKISGDNLRIDTEAPGDKEHIEHDLVSLDLVSP
jgi:hypothetical protein